MGIRCHKAYLYLAKDLQVCPPKSRSVEENSSIKVLWGVSGNGSVQRSDVQQPHKKCSMCGVLQSSDIMHDVGNLSNKAAASAVWSPLHSLLMLASL